MPYRAKPLAKGGIPADYPSQIGRGLAQIFPTYDPKPTIAMQQREAARRRGEKVAEQKEEQELYEKITTGDPKMYRNYVAAYSKEGIELRDELKENINKYKTAPFYKSEFDKKLELHNLKGQIGVATSAAMIKKGALIEKGGEFENMEAIEALTEQEFKELELPEMIKRLNDLAGVTKKVPEFDISNYLSTTGLRLLKYSEETNTISWNDPVTGQVLTQETTLLEPADTESVGNMLLKHAPLFEKAQREYNDLSSEEQAGFFDPKDYFVQTYLDPFLKEERKLAIKGAPGKGFEISIGSATTPLYEFTEREVDIPIVQLGTNIILPAGIGIEIKPTRALDITPIGRGVLRKFNIFQGDTMQKEFPGFKILTKPQYLLEIKGKKYILTRAEQFKADTKFAKEEGYEVGELVKETRDFLIPYDKYKKQFKAWSATKIEQGFDWFQYEKKQQKEPAKKTDPLGILD